MNTLKNFHPLTLFLYFLYVLFISVFSFNPIVLVSGLSGAVLYCLIISDKKAALKLLLTCIIMFLIVTLTNPLFSHNGKTVLFFINDNRVTLEAFIYGGVLGFAIAEVILCFKCFNLVFDSEMLIFLFGKISPKIALVFSMTLHFIPNLIRSFKEINGSQKTVNKHRVKRYLSSFSAVITLAMENSIITSDSMKARGYGCGKREYYNRFKITPADAVYIAVFTALFLLSIIFKSDFIYYPDFIFPGLYSLNIVGYTAFFILAFIPFLFELKEGVKWKYSISKI